LERSLGHTQLQVKRQIFWSFKWESMNHIMEFILEWKARLDYPFLYYGKSRVSQAKKSLSARTSSKRVIIPFVEVDSHLFNKCTGIPNKCSGRIEVWIESRIEMHLFCPLSLVKIFILSFFIVNSIDTIDCQCMSRGLKGSRTLFLNNTCIAEQLSSTDMSMTDG
jgi:hypothetical protein